MLTELEFSDVLGIQTKKLNVVAGKILCVTVDLSEFLSLCSIQDVGNAERL